MANKRVFNTWQLLLIGAVFGAGCWAAFTSLKTDTSASMMAQESISAGPDSSDPALATATSAPEDTSLWVQNELEFLRMEMEQAREERAELRHKFEQVTAALAANGAGDANGETLSTSAAADAGLAGAPISAGGPAFDALAFDAANASTADIQRQALLQSGIDIERVSQLQQQAFGQYLYNSGRPNRVAVQSIINGSAAFTAGVQVGDIIERYAGEFIFTSRDLRQATREGVRNESVVLQVVRNQQSLALSVVRGPLGVTMSAIRVAP